MLNDKALLIAVLVSVIGWSFQGAKAADIHSSPNSDQAEKDRLKAACKMRFAYVDGEDPSNRLVGWTNVEQDIKAAFPALTNTGAMKLPALVSFTEDELGRVSAVKLERSSGDKDLDRVLLKTISSAPPSYGRNSKVGPHAQRDYLFALKQSLKSKWVIPQGMPLSKVLVTFSVNEKGTAQNIRISSGSGTTPLDRSALKAINDAVFRPLPLGMPKRLDLEATFDPRSDGGMISVQPASTQAEAVQNVPLPEGKEKVSIEVAFGNSSCFTSAGEPRFPYFEVYLPSRPVWKMNNVWISRESSSRDVGSMSVREMEQNDRSLHFHLQPKIDSATAGSILAHGAGQEAQAPGTSYQSTQTLAPACLEIDELPIPRSFNPPNVCGNSVGNRGRHFGVAKLLAKTAKGREIWETQLRSFNSKSASSGVKEMLFTVGTTLIEVDLQNADKNPSPKEWEELVDTFEVVPESKLDKMPDRNGRVIK